MPSEILGESFELNDYTAAGQAAFEYSKGIAFPSVAHFEYDSNGESHEITYIAARHATGQGIKHPTCQKIIKEFERQKPDCVIVEGISRDQIEEGRDWANASMDSCGESEVLLKLAIDNDIPFVGGEPADETIQAEMLEQGYNEMDIYVQGFISNVHGAYKMGEKYDSIEEYLEKYSGSTAYFDDFNRWCEGRGYQANLTKMLKSECTAPIKDGDFIQKLTYDIGLIRNTQILKTLEECSHEYQKVLIVYGCSHYYEQYPTLTKKFGAPEYEPESFWSRAATHISNIFNYFF